MLITGSRIWKDRSLVWHALGIELQRSPNGLTVVHGACPYGGADDIADRWAWGMRQEGHNVVPEPHRADWESYGKAAGPIRNQLMVDLGADVCLAFPLGVSRGTRHCMAAAEKAGIPVISFGDRS
ncbi:hypothetical protein ODIN_64 [Mycobacterium phage Odin]|nr:hypothetical protein ODIN_64 [Mycobacterium phage Odin]